MGQQVLGAGIAVTDKNEKSKPMAEQREEAPRAIDRTAAQEGSAEEIEIQPTLVGYFGETRVSPSAFFKVLHKNKVKRFKPADQEAAAALVAAHDPEGERLWALMSNASLPEAVDAWIWEAAQSRLRKHLGESFEPQDQVATRIFEVVLGILSPSFHSDQKQEKKRAETWLRIAICWLVEKRALKAWQIAEHLRPIFFSEPMAASRLAERAVQKGRSGELRLAAAMVGLGDQVVQAADEERDRARSIAGDLRQRLDDALAELERLNSDLDGAMRTIAEQQATISRLEETLAAERQHWGHDLTETKAKQRVLLGERLGPLLEDAIDALEIEPPAPGTALRRIKAAAALTKEAKE